MALETKDINNAADMRRYVEGCLNDLMEGLSNKDETMKYLHDYTLRVIDITVERVGKHPDTSDEALHIGSVGGNEVALRIAAQKIIDCTNNREPEKYYDAFMELVEAMKQ